MLIKTSDTKSIKPYLQDIFLPKPNSHKGKNGKVLIIGGSSLFHSASIWAAETASHFADMVHYSSIEENNEIFLALKKKFRNGIVVGQKDLLSYVEEDDVILIGPGMVRNNQYSVSSIKYIEFENILRISDEAEYTYYLTKYLLENYPEKKFVIDAGALQMMDSEWLRNMKVKPILTPHQGEFNKLFGKSVSQLSVNEKAEAVQKQAKKSICVILLKAVKDYISDGEKTVIVEGGNPGLTKGGTGDILAGLAASLYARNEAFDSSILASYLLKKTADKLFLHSGYWYNVDDIISAIPAVTTDLLLK